MAGVEAQSQQRRVGPRAQRVDLLRRLDVAAAVVVKHRSQPASVAHLRRDALGAARERIPLHGGQTVFRSNSSSADRTPGYPRVVVRKDDERIAPGGGSNQLSGANG